MKIDHPAAFHRSLILILIFSLISLLSPARLLSSPTSSSNPPTMRSVAYFLLTLLSLASQSSSLSLPPNKAPKLNHQVTRQIALSTILTAATSTFILPNLPLVASAQGKFTRYPSIRFIAALGDPKASSGTGAETWGLWRDDPGK